MSLLNFFYSAHDLQQPKFSELNFYNKKISIFHTSKRQIVTAFVIAAVFQNKNNLGETTR